MCYIGQEVSERMRLLKISLEELADKTFMDIKDIQDILEDRVALSDIDDFDMALICSVLHCKPEYFSDEEIRSKDLLTSTMNRGCDNDASVKVKARLQDFLSDFAFVKEILEETTP